MAITILNNGRSSLHALMMLVTRALQGTLDFSDSPAVQ